MNSSQIICKNETYFTFSSHSTEKAKVGRKKGEIGTICRCLSQHCALLTNDPLNFTVATKVKATQTQQKILVCFVLAR